jgi:selenocysteine lyase/cysteine desulfurase
MLEVEGLTTSVISDHVTKLQQQFLSASPLPMMTLLNPLSAAPHARFLAFKGEAASQIHDGLNAYEVVTDVRGDVLRIGFGVYQDESDIDQLLAILKTVVER